MSPDTYTAAQAAQLLGVSERRVRQLVSEGKLPGSRDRNGALRLPQAAVNAERKKRRLSDGRASGRKRTEPLRAGRRASGQAVDVEELASAVAAAVGKNLEGQLELTRRAESLVRQELDEERARRQEVEARLAEARRELETLRKSAAQRRRGFFRKAT